MADKELLCKYLGVDGDIIASSFFNTEKRPDLLISYIINLTVPDLYKRDNVKIHQYNEHIGDNLKTMLIDSVFSNEQHDILGRPRRFVAVDRDDANLFYHGTYIVKSVKSILSILFSYINKSDNTFKHKEIIKKTCKDLFINKGFKKLNIKVVENDGLDEGEILFLRGDEARLLINIQPVEDKNVR